MKTKNDYQKYIHVYVKRREEYKIKGRNFKPLTTKIAGWKKQIKRIEVKESIMKTVDTQITVFLGLSPKTGETIPRRFFYRWCLENGVNSLYIRQYLGITSKTIISRGRMNLIRNKKQNELYKRFLKYIEDGLTI